MERKGSSERKKFRFIAGIILVTIGLLNLIGGGGSYFMDRKDMDSEGYHLSEVYEIRSDSCAFFLNHLSYNTYLPDPKTIWIVEPKDQEKELFVGWTYYSEIAKYEGSFPFETPKNWEWYFFPYSSTIDIPNTNIWNENSPNAPTPGEEKFWINNLTSKDSTIRLKWDAIWEPKNQLRTLVIMNSDGSRNVSADITFGSRIPVFQVLPYPLIGIGVILVIVGVALIINSKR